MRQVCSWQPITNYRPNGVVEYSYEWVCFLEDDNNDSAKPPTSGSGGGSGVSGAPPGGLNFIPDPSGAGSVVVAAGTDASATPTDLNPGWNSGAYSIETLPVGWTGMVSFDIPDVLNARPGGVAIGFSPVSELPSMGRNGYGQLHYGVVFTADSVRIVQGSAVAMEVSYATVRATRAVGSSTDVVKALLYGTQIKWTVNGVALFAGAFTMPEAYALDATLYTAYDTVDNPLFTAGAWDAALDEGSLTGQLPAFSMLIDMTADDTLVASIGSLTARLMEEDVWEMVGSVGGFTLEMGDGDGITGTLGITLRMAESADFDTLEGSLGKFSAWMSMSSPGDDVVPVSSLVGTLGRFTMTMDMPRDITLIGNLTLSLRMGEDTTGMELVGSISAIRFSAYMGEFTPLINIIETLALRDPVYQEEVIALSFIERINGMSTAVGYATITADATEHLTLQDSVEVMATTLDSMVEQLGAGERLVTTLFRLNGSVVDEGQAWVVTTESNATTRYDAYGFNSFFALSGKHYGVRQDGVYLLEGAADAGQPISSGVALGKHDFGTQALKGLDAVYVGVSSTGTLYLRVGDGKNSYTYAARATSETLEAQRFDVGRGLRANYFTFDLVSEGEAFELDNITFRVLASQRRI